MAFERRDQCAILFIDGTLPAEVVIVLRNLEHPLARHVLTAEHVLEEREDVFFALRPSKREQQQGIVLEYHRTILLPVAAAADHSPFHFDRSCTMLV